MGFAPEPGRHLILGGNGAGKTSLLEAIYAVATTKSFRTPRLTECVGHGAPDADSFTLRAEAIDPSGARATLALAWTDGGRVRSVNGESTDLAEHLAVLPVVAWDSSHVEILTGGPRLRRRFLDRSVVGRRPGAIDLLMRYRRALGQKREVLARGTTARSDNLHAWNQVLAAAAAEVIAARAEATRRLTGALATVLEAIDLDFPPIALAYRPSPACGENGADAVAARFAEIAQREVRRAMPVEGPHRDELAITWGGHPVAQVASAGERKTLSLALALAQGQELEDAGRSPVYLLDDLDAELAVPTLAAVWGALEDAGQLFASSNRPAAWDALGVDFRWSMEGGVLEPSPGSSAPGSNR